jgi:uncharacterized protein
MIINVSQLLKEHIGSARSYSVEGDDYFPYKGEVVVIRTDEGLLVRGNLTTVVGAVCSRCMGDFDQELPVRFAEEFLLQREEGAFVIDEYRQIDLSEVARQYKMLAEPMKPLCREDCAGLCARCGRNLNLGACDCVEETDPRLAVLASLVKDRL